MPSRGCTPLRLESTEPAQAATGNGRSQRKGASRSALAPESPPVVLAASAISLIGMPPLIGFFGKLALFSAGIEAGQVALVIIAAVNSAISAFYYLQLVAVPMLGQPNARTETVQAVPSAWPRLAAVLCGVGVLVLPLGLSKLVEAAVASPKAPTAAVAAAK